MFAPVGSCRAAADQATCAGASIVSSRLTTNSALTGMFKALQFHFPKFDWNPWLFRQAPNGYWHDLENCRKYPEWLADQLGFNTKTDWYRVGLPLNLETLCRNLKKAKLIQ